MVEVILCHLHSEGKLLSPRCQSSQIDGEHPQVLSMGPENEVGKVDQLLLMPLICFICAVQIASAFLTPIQPDA